MSEEVEAASIPVVEEELKVDRGEVETGRVRVRTVPRLFLVEEVRLTRRASTAPFEQPVQLRSQRVAVEREEPGGEAEKKE